MYLSMLSPEAGAGGSRVAGFNLASFFLFKCPTPGMLSWIKEYKFTNVVSEPNVSDLRSES